MTGLYNCLTCELSGLSYHDSLVHEIAVHGRADPDVRLDPETGEVVPRKERPMSGHSRWSRIRDQLQKKVDDAE